MSFGCTYAAIFSSNSRTQRHQFTMYYAPVPAGPWDPCAAFPYPYYHWGRWSAWKGEKGGPSKGMGKGKGQAAVPPTAEEQKQKWKNQYDRQRAKLLKIARNRPEVCLLPSISPLVPIWVTKISQSLPEATLSLMNEPIKYLQNAVANLLFWSGAKMISLIHPWTATQLTEKKKFCPPFGAMPCVGENTLFPSPSPTSHPTMAPARAPRGACGTMVAEVDFGPKSEDLDATEKSECQSDTATEEWFLDPLGLVSGVSLSGTDSENSQIWEINSEDFADSESEMSPRTVSQWEKSQKCAKNPPEESGSPSGVSMTPPSLLQSWVVQPAMDRSGVFRDVPRMTTPFVEVPLVLGSSPTPLS